MQKHPGAKDDQGFLLVPRLKREGRKREGKEAAADVELTAEAAPQELGPPSRSPQPAAPTARGLGAPFHLLIVLQPEARADVASWGTKSGERAHRGNWRPSPQTPSLE